MARLTRIRSVDSWQLAIPSRMFDRGVVGRGRDYSEQMERFAKQLSGVCECYSRHLAEVEPVPAETWWLRIVLVRNVAEGGFFDTLMDPALLGLPAADKPLAYLDWLHRYLVRLAAARGWPGAGFTQAYRSCRAHGAVFRWYGSAKSSRDRRYKATPEYHFDAEGDAWLNVRVRDRDGDLVAEGGPWDCYPEFRFMRQSAKSLRWEGSSAVTVEAWDPGFAQAWGLEAVHTLVMS